MQDQEMKAMLADLIWLNALIATELIQVTENTSAILRKSSPPERLPAGAPRTPRNSALHCREIPEAVPCSHNTSGSTSNVNGSLCKLYYNKPA